ncbi:MAG: hypothetical protein K0R00_303 [Herbinix sp.]|nr:hypothetical protein [Herbinix sp.]
MLNKMSKEDCLELMRLKASAVNNLPRKSDFTELEVSRIKSYFGPWPRALEVAGLKTPKQVINHE